MNDFFSKDIYTIRDIQDLIDNEVEESVHLEFKSAGALGKWDSKKAEMTKDVAAFANADGGIIVYGLSEQNHKAYALSFIDGNVFTKEWIEQVLNSGIQQKIKGLRIYPIRKDGNVEQSIYVVKIPKSYDTPHMSKDKKFYRRYNFEAVPMEEYEIRDLYNRKSRSKLLIQGYYIGEFQENDKTKSFHFLAQIANEGAVPESSYKLNVYMSCPELEKLNITWDDVENISYTVIERNKVKLSATGKTPIYEGECLDMARFTFDIPKEIFEQIVTELTIHLILLYSGGKYELDIPAEIIREKLQS